MSSSRVVIESRVQLFSSLSEAAELEHNLMCLYLYAMFSLKRTEDEGLSKRELEFVEKWRRVIMSVALEEMTHLTLISNMTVAIGASPHFMRPNFPASPGYYPENIIVELAPFSMSSIDHFIYLERPDSESLNDGESFQASQHYNRESPSGRLMPHPGDYETVGVLYQSIQKSLENLCQKFGEKELFCGNLKRQIGPLNSALPGLILITDLKSATQAIDTIVTQGEGAKVESGSHFDRFKSIKREYEMLLKENPNFEPARNVARNPLMRKPISMEGKVWIQDALAVKYLDLANALYVTMLRILVQIYAYNDREETDKKIMLETAFDFMHAMASVSELLTHLPSCNETPEIKAGISFAMVRSLAPLDSLTEKKLLNERLVDVIASIEALVTELTARLAEAPHVQTCLTSLIRTKDQLIRTQKRINGHNEILANAKNILDDSAKSSAKENCEVVASTQIKMSFEANKCMHARHCVTELPNVFKANTPGEWLYPDQCAPDLLEAVIRECPSGALKYERLDGHPNEEVPAVNMIRLRENGPLAFRAEMTVDGKKECHRLTLCRCGQSKSKPYCDGSHGPSSFRASGEPDTMDASALAVRNGPLIINRTNDGPLEVKGNIEICAGTGRVVLRSQDVRLCRCGHSKMKPVCDSSHMAAGFRDSVS